VTADTLQIFLTVAFWGALVAALVAAVTKGGRRP
jgi:hypothetical protein